MNLANGLVSTVSTAAFGVGGKGKSDVQNVSRFGIIYALCDVDSTILDGLARSYKTEHNFSDYREMLDRLGDRIDAVTISVPDHNHAVMASKAMKMGKHVYCQKPLTHSIHETRVLTEYARQKRLVTQMGIQIHSQKVYRQAVALVQSGVIGKAGTLAQGTTPIIMLDSISSLASRLIMASGISTRDFSIT